MHNFLRLVSLPFLLPCLLVSLGAQAQVTASSSFIPPPPQIAAKSWLLLDVNSGQFITGYKIDDGVEPASLSKLMTAYITFDALKQKKIKPEQNVPVSKRAWKSVGSRMFIEPRKPVTVDELIRGMIVQSGNDAAVALAELIGGSEDAFAQLMNREAKRLGLTSTNFVNATGMPDTALRTTPRDLALLTRALIRDYPEFYPLYAQKEYRYNNITQPNRNRLLWRDDTVDGVKTGHTESAGYCLIASAKRGERRLISVVMGAASAAARATESQKLLNYGFQGYDSVRLYEKNKPVTTLRVWKGAINNLRAGFQSDIYVTAPKGMADKLKANVESQQPLLAPVRTGQKVGTLKIELDGKPWREMPLVALDDAPVAGVFGRAWDTLRLYFS
jgi:serine-type D-Ala-D-Ala carboxypeptidase (penicillin-binding protein 5/6)